MHLALFTVQDLQTNNVLAAECFCYNSFNLLEPFYKLCEVNIWKQPTIRINQVSPACDVAYFRHHVHSDFIPHFIPPHNSLLFHLEWWKWTSRDPGGSSWLLHWTDVVMIPEGKTLRSKKRALPKPISYSMKSEGLTKLPHSCALWQSLHQS